MLSKNVLPSNLTVKQTLQMFLALLNWFKRRICIQWPKLNIGRLINLCIMATTEGFFFRSHNHLEILFGSVGYASDELNGKQLIFRLGQQPYFNSWRFKLSMILWTPMNNQNSRQNSFYLTISFRSAHFSLFNYWSSKNWLIPEAKVSEIQNSF